MILGSPSAGPGKLRRPRNPAGNRPGRNGPGRESGHGTTEIEKEEDPQPTPRADALHCSMRTMRNQTSTRSKRLRRLEPPPRRHNEARAYLRRVKLIPTAAEWDRLLMEEASRRFYTKTESAAALGLTREGYRRKLIRMGLD